MAKFQRQYSIGKQSEHASHSDLNKIFKTNLIHDKDKFAHYDFFSKDEKIFVELKTRPNTKFNGEYFIHTKEDDTECIFNSLYFDCPKKWVAYRNRNTDKRFFIVWKCSNEYFYWEINHDKKDYYIEDQFRDCGMGYAQERNVVNVKEHALQRVI